MFRTVPVSISLVFHCTHSNGICHTGLLTACDHQDQDGSVPVKLTENLYDIYHCCVHSKKVPLLCEQ
jgi:hypothetical protein